ncbi:MAG: tRNA pseudouridine(55) synthase TruB [Phycisphaerales bacterium]|nr:tRNA pseudouridine(55) synthase TruB [Phycisphaerales bacterium]
MSGSLKPPRPSTVGILILDKPVGRTSMQAVATVRRRAGGVRTGHAGTLDPLATGVLVIALGRATKSIDRLMATDKRYRTEIDLSAFTTTDDREGERTEVDVVTPPSREAVEAALARFVGPIMQAPPTFSAVKIGGRRAYQLARRGRPADIPARPVTIHALRLDAYDYPRLEISIHCGKGVYVRSLARNLGEALGTGGHCAWIRRTAVGPFTVDEAMTLDAVPDPLEEAMLISIDDAMARVEADGASGPVTSVGGG